MAAKGALKRLLPASTCSGWSAYGELNAYFAKKPRNVQGRVINIATVLPGSQLIDFATNIVQVLPSCVLARHKEYYFE